MIVLAILILILILIIASTAVSFFNKAYPPCNAKDYFNAARTLPDGINASLGSVQSGTDINYIGAKLTETHNGIGLKSRNSDYNPIDDQDTAIDNDETATDYVDPDRILYKQKLKKRLDKQLTRQENNKNKESNYDQKLESIASSILSEYFTEENKEHKENQARENQTIGKYKNQNIAMFEKIMEGVKAPNQIKRKSGSNSIAQQTSTDGYKEMQSDKW